MVADDTAMKCRDPRSKPSADARAVRRRATQQCTDDRHIVVGQFDVVDLGGGSTVAVDDLPIEEAEPDVEIPSLDHDPAFVMIIRGMAATAATTVMTR